MIKCFLVELESFHDLVISFKELDRIPSLLFFRQAVNAGFFDVCEGMFDGTAEGVHRNGLAVFCSFDCCSCSLIRISTLQGGDRNEFDTHLFG